MSTVRFDLDHAWREAPAMATPSTLRISATFLLGLAGGIVLLCTLVMSAGAEVRLTLAGVAVAVLLSGAMCAAVGHRLPRWSYELVVTGAIVLITLVAWRERDHLNVLAVTAFYLLPVIAGAMQFSLRKAIPVLLLALLLRGWVTSAAGVALPEGEEYDTVAGLVLRLLGRIPLRGDSAEVRVPDLSDPDEPGERTAVLTVEHMDGLRIDRLSLRVVP